MPYIKKEDRTKFFHLFDIAEKINSVGELNYCITKLAHEYLYKKGSPKYTDYNEIIGVLECAKLEFYRRKVEFYENEKIKQNGDV